MPAPIDWRTTVAQRVCTLVRDIRVLGWFRAQIPAFLDEAARDEGQLAAWLRQRREHCRGGLRTLAEFKARSEEGDRLGNDRDAIERTRPADDTDKTWVFDYYHDILGPDELARLGEPANGPMPIGFSVWVPPNLRLSASPKLTVPPLFGRFTGQLHSPPFGRTIEPGRASLAEKYASLGVIHDVCFPDRDPINELHYVNEGRLTEELRRRERKALAQLVRSLPSTAEANVSAWLADVEADVAERFPAYEPESQGTSAEKPNERRWLNRVAESVHEDVRDARYRNRYLQMTRGWAERMAAEGRWKGIQLRDFIRQEHPDWTEHRIEAEVIGIEQRDGGKPVQFREDPIAITTHRTTPLDKKYATLAAIHDALHGCGYPLSPWKGEAFRNPFGDDATEKDAEDLAARSLYGELCENVATLTDDDRPGIEQILTEVSLDLEKHCAALQSAETTSAVNQVPENKPPVPKRPSDSAFIAWRLRDLKGFKTQQEIADAMSEQLERRVHQGEVSRWLDEVDVYRNAGGVFPDLPGLASKPQVIDSGLIDMGERQDHRTPRQRGRRDPDAE